MKKSEWPKKPTFWINWRILHVSIPFTWNLPFVRSYIMQRSMEWDTAMVGGPATQLIPDYFNDLSFVAVGDDYPGVLQIVNPMATRTTVGCVRKCDFCGVGQNKIENGGFKCLDDWPDLPVICDNNLLAAPIGHFDRVIDRLKKHDGVDFNQGLDARFLTNYHANKIASLPGLAKSGVRLALDSHKHKMSWLDAFNMLRSAGVAKNKISSYAIVGFDSDPIEAWERCEWVESHGIKVFPMWFHGLDQMDKNIVTEKQEKLGWNDYERRKIMQWFYQHRKAAKLHS